MVMKTSGALANGDNPINLPSFLTPPSTLTFALPVNGTFAGQR